MPSASSLARPWKDLALASCPANAPCSRIVPKRSGAGVLNNVVALCVEGVCHFPLATVGKFKPCVASK